MMVGMYRLLPHIQAYAWGSTTAFTDLLGLPATGAPQAELWLGAHPALPADVVLGDRTIPLDEAIAADPAGWLGAAVITRFGSTLPFLVKVLSAAEPLSIQAHPSKAQAEAGFARDNALGLVPDAPNRNYRDANHKPELICALTDFEGLCGFRSESAAVALFRRFQASLLREAASAVETQGMGPALGLLLRASREECNTAIADVVGRAFPDLHHVAELAQRYPGDPGVAVALLLNHVVLAPGEALYLGAGNLHAYLRGTGVEIMANSDNVLRGGLTSKHVDVDELLRVVHPEPGALPRATSEAVAKGLTRWPVAVADFLLWRAQPTQSQASVAVPVGGPAVVLCTEGFVQCVSEDGAVELGRGEAAVSRSVDALLCSGQGTLFVGSVGLIR